MLDPNTPKDWATTLLQDAVTVFTHPALLAIVILAILGTWAGAMAWYSRQVKNAESARDLFKDRYELEKENHQALRDTVGGVDPSLLTKALKAAPAQWTNVLTRLARGEHIITPVDPTYHPKTYILVEGEKERLQLAALANAAASGLAQTTQTPQGLFSTGSTAATVRLVFMPDKDKGDGDKKS